ncbi:MAG: hypothetical protein CEE43_18555 [Promethearchaeota archaeon Loki_b32]|nr:MAG: hypothetical protein CEE43_18555 [Candidatus Lokiarchaeota archaeon Loki_b32]
MPHGFIITEWTEDQGLVVKLSYPEDLQIDLDDMMRIFYAHITGAGEAGNVLVRLEKARSNVSSYFTGLDSDMPVMINLMLELGEDPEMFGETVLKEIDDEILNYLRQMSTDVSQSYEIVKKIRLYLKNTLILLDRLKNLSKEQRLAQIYCSEKARTILEALQEKPLFRRELQGIIEEKLNKIVPNIEYVLDPFIKTGLIMQDWVEGDTDITLFLLSDFTIFRTPVAKLVEDAKKNFPTPEIASAYLEEVTQFFKDYKPNLEDNLKIAQTIMNPDNYDFITLFRERAYPLNKIPKAPGQSVDEVGSFLKNLENEQIIKLIKDNKDTVWVMLLTDIVAHTFYPEYLIEKIRKERMDGNIKKTVAIKHLEFLEKTYKK